MSYKFGEIKIKKLSSEELGPFRLEMASLLASSPDPFAFLEYNIDITRCKVLSKKLTAETGVRITMTHVLNKILAIAVDENPVFNQVVLGKDIYQLEDIFIANGYLIPGTECALSYVLIKNAHELSLEEIRKDLLRKQEERAGQFLAQRSRFTETIKRFIFRYNLLRFVSEKFVFSTALKKGLISNIVFINQIYQKPATFKVIKPVITPMKISLRIHAHGWEEKTMVEDGQPVIKEILPVHVAVDHRVMHGIHAHRFGESLERITLDPEKYLQ